jgi:hypothetical protein
MGTVYIKGQSVRHVSTSRASITYKSPVAALKISRAVKRGSRHCAIVEAWAMVNDLGRAA